MNTEIAKQEAPLSKVRRQRYVRPYFEVEDLEHVYEVKVHLPGVGRDQATVALDKGTLVVEAVRGPHWNETSRAIHREIPDADYRLRLQLNVLVNEGEITAQSKDGILTIHLPVAEEAKPRTITIK